MNKPRRSKETLEEFRQYLEDPNLIGVAFFLKDATGQVVMLGEIGHSGIAVTGDNLWEAIESFDMICRINDADIARDFGESVVKIPYSEEELIARTAAVESLRDSLQGREGILDVQQTHTSIMVKVTGEGRYDGPWEWEGFSVHAEVES